MIKIYKVGGCVRDAFLGVDSKDIDYAVEAPSYEAMRDYVMERGKIWLETPEYNTIRGRIDNEDVDFVLCRKDGEYTDGRRPDYVVAGTIFDDLARRDFTMNAIAVDEDGNILDPYDGMRDIRRGIIRCVGDTRTRFEEDSLRILRAFRFSITKNFEMDIEVAHCLQDLDMINSLKNVSEERIREELQKCFHFDTLETLQQFEGFPCLRDWIFSNSNTDIWLSTTTVKRKK